MKRRLQATRELVFAASCHKRRFNVAQEIVFFIRLGYGQQVGGDPSADLQAVGRLSYPIRRAV
jgi:hypothetical protein